jgi:hypothetical protein
MASYGGYGPDASAIEEAIRSGTYYAPEGSPNPLGPGSNINELTNSINWGDVGLKALDALTKATAYKAQSSTPTASSYSRPQAANATVVGGGRGYTVFMPGQTQKTTQTAKSPGIFSSVASVAAPILGVIPGGQVPAAILAGAGRGASMFGY